MEFSSGMSWFAATAESQGINAVTATTRKMSGPRPNDLMETKPSTSFCAPCCAASWHAQVLDAISSASPCASGRRVLGSYPERDLVTGGLVGALEDLGRQEEEEAAAALDHEGLEPNT